MMKLLIQYGGNPNATDTEKWTPLVRHFIYLFRQGVIPKPRGCKRQLVKNQASIILRIIKIL